MEDGSKYLEERKNKSIDKFLELDIKIPEVFVLATSVAMIFLSTMPQGERDAFFWLSFASFILVLFLSLSTLFFAKNLYKDMGIITKEFLNKMNKLSEEKVEQGVDIELYKKLYKEKIDKLVETYKDQSSKKIRRKRKYINILLGAIFVLFLVGLVSLIF